MRIAEYNQAYPDFSSLSKEQRKSYEYICSCIEHQKFIDVEENNSYIMLFLNELVNKLISGKQNLNYFEERFNFIK